MIQCVQPIVDPRHTLGFCCEALTGQVVIGVGQNGLNRADLCFILIETCLDRIDGQCFNEVFDRNDGIQRRIPDPVIDILNQVSHEGEPVRHSLSGI